MNEEEQPHKPKRYRVVDYYARCGRLFQARMVSCGRVPCAGCMHGPYWYEVVEIKPDVWRSVYLGKLFPGEPESKSGLYQQILLERRRRK